MQVIDMLGMRSILDMHDVKCSISNAYAWQDLDMLCTRSIVDMDITIYSISGANTLQISTCLA